MDISAIISQIGTALSGFVTNIGKGIVSMFQALWANYGYVFGSTTQDPLLKNYFYSIFKELPEGPGIFPEIYGLSHLADGESFSVGGVNYVFYSVIDHPLLYFAFVFVVIALAFKVMPTVVGWLKLRSNKRKMRRKK